MCKNSSLSPLPRFHSKKLCWTLGVLALGLGYAIAPARAQTTTCTGFTAPGSSFTNLFVPSSADCTLVSPTTVTGNVLVGSGGSLHIIYAVVQGNISATGAAFIGFDAGTVGGNLTLARRRAVSR
jgi:hypothetical protein